MERTTNREPWSRDELALAVLLALAVVGSVLAIGAVHVVALLAIGVVIVAAATVALRLRPPLPAASPAIVAAALAVWSLVQSVPLPRAWVVAIAPANADVWARALMPLGEPGPSYVSLSLDPGASTLEALKWSLYAATFFSAATLAARRGALLGLGVVSGSALLAALTTIGHGLAGATKVWGVYQPTFLIAAWHVGPLLNANNLAGYLNLGALTGLGIALMRRPPVPRWLIGVGVAAVVGTLVTSASRGGVCALILGLVPLSLILRRSRKSGGMLSGKALLPFAGAIVGGAALAILAGTQAIWEELYDKNLDKITAIGWTRPMLAEFPWFGIGRGAFESVFPAYRMGEGNFVFTHPENFPAQWATEWGIPVAVVAFGALAWLLRPWRLGVRRSAAAAGAVVGIGMLLVQNMVDLGLEIPAVCLAVSVVLGSLWGEAATREKSGPTAFGFDESPRRSSRRARIVGLVPAALGIVLGCLVLERSRDVADERHEALERYDALGKVVAATSGVELRAWLRGAMLRHPAEPYFPLLGAALAWRTRSESPLPWIQRVLERSRTNGRPHLLLAEILGSKGLYAQGLLELRIATEVEPQLAATASEFAVRWTRDLDALMQAVQPGVAGVPMLEAMAQRLSTPQDAELRREMDRKILERDPKAANAHLRLAADLVDSLASEDADRAAVEKEVQGHAAALATSLPNESAAARVRARLLRAQGKAIEADRLLTAECTRVEDRLGCLYERVAIASHVKAPERIEAASRDLLAVACGTASGCAAAASYVGALRAGRKEFGAAVNLFARAARDEPKEWRYRQLGEVASQAGLHAQAADAFERAAQKRGGPDPELARRITEERSMLDRRLIPPPIK